MPNVKAQMSNQYQSLNVKFLSFGFGILFVIWILTFDILVRAQAPPPPPEPIYGWFWTHGFGWVSLNSENCTTRGDCLGTRVKYGLEMNQTDGTLTGYAWSPNAGWMCVGATCSGLAPDGVIPSTRVNQINGEVSGWAKFLAMGNEGWVKLHGTLYAMNVDTGTKIWRGFAWGSTDSRVGPGWVKAASVIGGSFGYPWFETRGGDVVGGKGINLDRVPPPGRASATYLIETKDAGAVISNAVSYCSLAGVNPKICGSAPFPEWLRKGGSVAELPRASKNFVTPTTRLDFAGLFAGHYGPVTTIGDGVFRRDEVLGGRVYHYKNNLTIEGVSVIFKNGIDRTLGAGTIVVDGDLIIKTDIGYDTGRVTDVRHLASLAWIVRGDLLIDPAVKKLVGTFIVLGKDRESCTGATPPDNCGYVTTGLTTDPLEISGALLARRVEFQRTTKSLATGAETVIADGRVLINTPPGLADIARGLPTWQ